MLLRSIKYSISRYLAIFAIVALGVGFFSGLKISKKVMVDAADTYFKKQEMFDFLLISTTGFTPDESAELDGLPDIRWAEESISLDALGIINQKASPYIWLSLPEKINLPTATQGRLPQTEGECLVDDDFFSAEDIGKPLSVSSFNTQDVLSGFSQTDYTIVGIGNSPLYISGDRGSTALGNGILHGFVYILPKCFASPVFSGVYLRLKETDDLYSEAYEQRIEKQRDKIAEAARTLVLARYEATSHDTRKEDQPQVYLFTRKENIGYGRYENDTEIVAGIANVFPVFFFLVAILVCVTTMSRMVDEERTQMGVMQAMGYSTSSIAMKYVLYAGSAALLGWFFGFFGGIWLIPQIIWVAYGITYHFSELSYGVDWPLALLTLAISLLSSVGAAEYSCHHELQLPPARLLRPRVPQEGKRILPEKIKFIWKRLTFLQKVSVRNVARYKKRMFMMVLGISGCTALLVAGFGIRDAVVQLVDHQYDDVLKYDMEVGFNTPMDSNAAVKFMEKNGLEDEHCLFAYSGGVEIPLRKRSLSAPVIAPATTEIKSFFHLHRGEEELTFPAKGEALINIKLSQKAGVGTGSFLVVENSKGTRVKLRVSGVFDNYVDHYLFVSPQTYLDSFGHAQIKTAYIHTEGTVTALMEYPKVSFVTVKADIRNRIENSMKSINAIVVLIVVCAAALAFIVLYNLTNINITERLREIATIKVLGFYAKEAASYVLRENILLTIIGAAVGLFLGKGLHALVVNMIVVDYMFFSTNITMWSFLLAAALTFVFTFVVNLVMLSKLDKIHMAESLKTVE